METKVVSVDVLAVFTQPVAGRVLGDEHLTGHAGNTVCMV